MSKFRKTVFQLNAMHYRRLSCWWMVSAFDCEVYGLLFDCIIPMDFFIPDMCDESIFLLEEPARSGFQCPA